jgi:hypothetical protein
LLFDLPNYTATIFREEQILLSLSVVSSSTLSPGGRKIIRTEEKSIKQIFKPKAGQGHILYDLYDSFVTIFPKWRDP